MRAKVRRVDGYIFLRWEAYSDEYNMNGYGFFRATAIWNLESKILKARKKKHGEWEEVELRI